MKIGELDVGHGNKTQIIAELSANHGQDISLAKSTISALSKTGVKLIKFQSYTPDSITLNSRKEYFRISHGTPWDSSYLYDLYKEAHMPWEWHEELFDFSRSLGLIPFSSPFDPSAVDLLESLDVPAYKVASYEISDIGLIKYMASTMKPIIISTGVASREDIQLAVQSCREVGNNEVIVLKCTSNYPTPPDEVNLIDMLSIKDEFEVEVGISDHTIGSLAAIGAAALGASLIEKHLMLNEKIESLDSGFSMTIQDFEVMKINVDIMNDMRGRANPEMPMSVKRARGHMRSLFVVKDVRRGEIVSESNVRSVRPSHGLHPQEFAQLKGKKFKVDVEANEPLRSDMIDYN